MSATNPQRSALDTGDGSIFAFRTTPLFPDSAPTTGRYGTIKVIGRTPYVIALVALDRVWCQPPTLAEAAACGVLRRRRHMSEGEPGEPALTGVDPDGPEILQELRLLGQAPLTQLERKYAARYRDEFALGNSFATPAALDREIEFEWRWEHDRPALEAEQQRDETRRQLAEEAEEARYETRLQNLTWNHITSEDPFAQWHAIGPAPPAEFTAQAAARVHQTVANLSELGTRPRKRAVRKELRTLAQWFTQADANFGGVIGPHERETILESFEDLAHTAGHPSLMFEMGDWVPW